MCNTICRLETTRRLCRTSDVLIVHTIRGSSDAPLDVPVSGWDLRDALPGAGGGGGASLLPAAGSGDAALAPVYNLQAAVVRDTP